MPFMGLALGGGAAGTSSVQANNTLVGQWKSTSF